MQPRTRTLNRVSLCLCTFTLTDGESGESALLISQQDFWLPHCGSFSCAAVRSASICLAARCSRVSIACTPFALRGGEDTSSGKTCMAGIHSPSSSTAASPCGSRKRSFPGPSLSMMYMCSRVERMVHPYFCAPLPYEKYDLGAPGLYCQATGTTTPSWQLEYMRTVPSPSVCHSAPPTPSPLTCLDSSKSTKNSFVWVWLIAAPVQTFR